MKYRVKSDIMFCLIFTFLCGGFSIKGQDLKRAQHFEVLQQYENAALEYEKLAFFSNDDSVRSAVSINAFDCYLAANKPEKAGSVLKAITLSTLPDSVAAGIRYRKALSSFLEGDYFNAEAEILENKLSANNFLNDDFTVLYALVLNNQTRWDEANQLLTEWVKGNRNFNPSARDSLIREINRMYSEENIPRFKKERTARIWAQFVPGGSYFYTGYYKEGMINAGLQLLFLAGTAYGIYSGYYVTSIVFGYGFFQRFYTGAIKNHKNLVSDRNRKRSSDFNESAQPFLLSLKKR